MPHSPKIKTSPLPVEATLDSNSLLNMNGSFSPDGKWVAYSISRISGWISKRGRCLGAVGINAADIVIVGTTTDATKVVAGGGSCNVYPAWSPDGRYVAFVSDRGANGHFGLWTWEIKTGELHKLSDIGMLSAQLGWTGDSRGIIAVVCDCPEEAGVESSTKPSPVSATVTVYESAPASDGGKQTASDPWSFGAPRDLVVFDIASGKARILVHASHISPFQAFMLSPDGTKIAFIEQKRFERPGSQQILYDLNIVGLDTGQKWTVARDIRLALIPSTFSWSPDSSRLAYQIDGVLEERNDCYVANVKSRIIRNVTGFSEGNPLSRRFPPAWDLKGENIYFVRGGAVWRASAEGNQASRLADIPGRNIIRLLGQDDGSIWSPDGGQSATVLTGDETTQQNGFYKMDLTTGRSSVLLEEGQHYWDVLVERFLKVSPNGRSFLYPVQGVEHPPDLWVADPSFSHPRRLTHINPVFDEYHLGSKQLIQWLSLDGEMLSGLLILPPDYEQGKKYPMIVSVYGGSVGQSNMFGQTAVAVINPHLFATRGYAVFLPDAPERPGTPMLDLAKAVLPGVNKVIEVGIADPKRLGLLGHSHGGYTVLSLLAQTSRFRAAVMSAGLGDLIGAYGQMDAKGAAFGTSTVEHGHGSMGGTPWEYRDRYIENSPIFHVDSIDTPLLIVHGSEDSTVAPFLADEVFVGMRRLGKDVVYAKYQGEHHSPPNWSHANQLDFNNRVIAWFDEHLK